MQSFFDAPNERQRTTSANNPDRCIAWAPLLAGKVTSGRIYGKHVPLHRHGLLHRNMISLEQSDGMGIKKLMSSVKQHDHSDINKMKDCDLNNDQKKVLTHVNPHFLSAEEWDDGRVEDAVIFFCLF